MSQFDEDMYRLDEGIKALKVEFNRYFTGALDRPPVELQNSLQGIIRDHTGHGEGRRTAEQFRFNALVSQYHILSEMWGRNVRNIEEGRPSVMDRRETTKDPVKPAGEQELFKTSLGPGESKPEHPALQKLYQSYLSAAQKGTGLSGTLSYRHFYTQVHKRMERFQEKNGSSQVTPRVVLVDKRPLLKVKSAP